MKTISEISTITGLSKRAIRFYDESGLLHPAGYSDSGYRLYDYKALETLQQIMFFKEFDVPLKDIKAILENPNLDKIALLKSHKEALTLKRNRLNNLIKLIDKTIKNPETMSFMEFDFADIEKTLAENFEFLKNDPNHKKQYNAIISQYGSYEKFNEVMMNATVANQDLIVDLYGSLENYHKSMQNLPERIKNVEECSNRLLKLYSKLAKMTDKDVSDKQVQTIIAEMDSLMLKMDMGGFEGKEKARKWYLKQIPKDPEQKKKYKEAFAEVKKMQDEKYGKGFTKFLNSASDYYLKNLKK